MLNLFVFGYPQLGIAEGVCASLLLPVFVLPRYDEWVSFSERLILIYGILITVALAVFGGLEGSGILWVFTFPFLAFLLKGQRSGWLYCFVWIAVMSAALRLAFLVPHSHFYSAAYSGQISVAMLFYSTIAAAFNLVRSRFEAKLHERVQANTAKAREYLDKLEFLALHDQTTGLPNRVSLLQDLSSAIEVCDTQRQSIVVINLRLERIFEISNILGQKSADSLIKGIANSLLGSAAEKGHLSRARRDEFSYFYKLDHREITADMVRKAIGDFQLTYHFEGYPVHIEHTVGVAIFPDHSLEAEDLLRKAGQAMLQASASRTDLAIFDNKLGQLFIKRHLLYGQLREALDNKELCLYFQAQVDMRTGGIIGAEALVRWKNADGIFIPPDEFIPVAEGSGLIKPLTAWVLREAFSQMVKWRSQGLEITVSINLSARNMIDPELIADLQKLLVEFAIPADSVMLEITESAFADLPEVVMDTIDQLHKIGFKLSIDDFGTGYSSLSYLKNLKVNEIKVDQSFVRCLHTESGSFAIVKSTIQLAHNLGLKVVAEGIESAGLENSLRAMACDIGQGYAYSRPLPADQFFTLACNDTPHFLSVETIPENDITVG
ncbi:MAG: EAL domain-containing protein [Proteobacteria bacterium]|nr:EAL domain-containing protein [Pseudomonadota bacterium]